MRAIHYRSIHESLRPGLFGGKAAGLSWLVRNGYPAPPAFALVALSSEEWRAISTESLVRTAGELVDALADISPAGLVLRSSATDEDTYTGSAAGRYCSVRVTSTAESVAMGLRTLVETSSDRLPKGERLGIVLQHWIDVSFGGVASSTDPVDFHKGICIIEESPGSAARVAQEGVVTTRSIVRLDQLSDSRIPMDHRHLLAKWLSEIETRWRAPVEVEWATHPDGTLLLLQCRRIVLPTHHRGLTVVDLGDSKALERIPALLRVHPKVLLRTQLAAMGVATGRATLFTAVSTGASNLRLPDAYDIPRSRTAAGLSAVLLHPKRIEGRVRRDFLTLKRDDVEFFTAGCQRYSIRRYPSKAGISQSIAALLRQGLRRNWLASVMVQEIVDGAITGLLCEMASGAVLVELAAGHFIPKGLVSTRRYLVNQDMKLVTLQAPTQTEAYWLMDGYVVHEEPLDQDDLLMPSPDSVADFAAWVRPVSERYPNRVWEFGAIFDSIQARWIPYMIDYIESKKSSLPAPELVARGVISPGRVAGIVKRITGNAIGRHLDLHHEDLAGPHPQEGRTVFVAERPDIALLDTVYEAAYSGSTFLFRSGTLLSHTAIIMRELGVAGLVIGRQIDDLRDGQWIDVGASAAGLTLRMGEEEVPPNRT